MHAHGTIVSYHYHDGDDDDGDDNDDDDWMKAHLSVSVCLSHNRQLHKI